MLSYSLNFILVFLPHTMPIHNVVTGKYPCKYTDHKHNRTHCYIYILCHSPSTLSHNSNTRTFYIHFKNKQIIHNNYSINNYSPQNYKYKIRISFTKNTLLFLLTRLQIRPILVTAYNRTKIANIILPIVPSLNFGIKAFQWFQMT